MISTDVETISKVAAGIFGSIIVTSLPLMKLLRMWGRDKAASSVDNAESMLYKHLVEQVQSLSETLKSNRDEAELMIQEIAQLRTRVISLEGTAEDNQRLRKKLDAKDAEIEEAHNILVSTQKELRQVKDRLAKYETVTMQVVPTVVPTVVPIEPVKELPKVIPKESTGFNRDLVHFSAPTKS